MIGNHFRALSKKLDINFWSFKNFFILGDFNVEIEEQYIKAFWDNYGLKSLIRQSTCYKSPSSSTCIGFKNPKISKHMCARHRTVRFSFNDSDSYEKDFLKIKP